MFRDDHIDDSTAEAILAGHEVSGELSDLTAFTGALMRIDRPLPDPSVQLASMMDKGFSTEKGDLPATAASNVTGPATQEAGLPKWRKKKMIGEFLAGLSVAAKAALGIGIAAASVTAAGAAGALPEQAQNAVSAAVEAVTPFSFPDKAADQSDFGGRVSTDARDGGVDGATISDEAKQNGDAHRADAADNAGQPGQPGQNGLDRASTTPAAGHVPTSLPGGQPAATGLDAASQTPAADHLPEVTGAPESTPPADAGAQSSTGLDTAATTPGATHLPTSVPAGRP